MNNEELSRLCRHEASHLLMAYERKIGIAGIAIGATEAHVDLVTLPRDVFARLPQPRQAQYITTLAEIGDAGALATHGVPSLEDTLLFCQYRRPFRGNDAAWTGAVGDGKRAARRWLAHQRTQQRLAAVVKRLQERRSMGRLEITTMLRLLDARIPPAPTGQQPAPGPLQQKSWLDMPARPLADWRSFTLRVPSLKRSDFYGYQSRYAS